MGLGVRMCVAAPNIDPFRLPTFIPGATSNPEEIATLRKHRPGQCWEPIGRSKAILIHT
jgi:hypothetical protein